MNECLMTPQHEKKQIFGCQYKVNVCNGDQIKKLKKINE